MREVSSLISRRAELYRFVPTVGTLLELSTAEQQFDIETWWTLPKGYREYISRVVETDEDIGKLSKLQGKISGCVILPDVHEPYRCIEAGFRALAHRGVLAVAVTDTDPVTLLKFLQETGLSPIMAMPWGVGNGAYGFARRIVK